MRNHTGTHLLHAGLHRVLGEHARQAGSLVAPDRLRFDFNHPEAMTAEQLERVERLVNEAAAADMLVLPKIKSREDAIAEGAMALFGEKYGETVRTITITPLAEVVEVGTSVAAPTAVVERQPKYSYELCGGTHLERTSDVGAFLILSEGSAAAGIRRIEAVTGRAAYDLIAHRFRLLRQAAQLLKTSPDDVPVKVEAMQDTLDALGREAAALRASSAVAAFERNLDQVVDVSGTKLLAAELRDANVETLRTLADRFRALYPSHSAAVLLSGSLVLAVVADDLVKRGIRAADVIAALGGKGGGRPGMAQGSLAASVDRGRITGALSDFVRLKLA
jgi:alanyl-tRNA synthetase